LVTRSRLKFCVLLVWIYSISVLLLTVKWSSFNTTLVLTESANPVTTVILNQNRNQTKRPGATMHAVLANRRNFSNIVRQHRFPSSLLTTTTVNPPPSGQQASNLKQYSGNVSMTSQMSTSGAAKPGNSCDVGETLEYVTLSVIMSFFLPLVIILVVYLRIYMIIRKRESNWNSDRSPKQGSSRSRRSNKKSSVSKVLISKIFTLNPSFYV